MWKRIGYDWRGDTFDFANREGETIPRMGAFQLEASREIVDIVFLYMASF
jgi:hypothetical protein